MGNPSPFVLSTEAQTTDPVTLRLPTAYTEITRLGDIQASEAGMQVPD